MLKPCIECNQQISVTARQCPKCKSAFPHGLQCCLCREWMRAVNAVQPNGEGFKIGKQKGAGAYLFPEHTSPYHKECIASFNEYVRNKRAYVRCAACTRVGTGNPCSECGHYTPYRTRRCHWCNLWMSEGVDTIQDDMHDFCVAMRGKSKEYDKHISHDSGNQRTSHYRRAENLPSLARTDVVFWKIRSCPTKKMIGGTLRCRYRA